MWELLTEAQVEQIHGAVLRILDEIGLSVQDAETVERLEGAGCRVARPYRVYVPGDLVEKTLAQIPAQFSVYGREPGHDVRIGNEELHGLGGGGAPSILDMETGEFRDVTRRDVGQAARVMDALPNLHVASPIGEPRDAPTRAVVPFEFAAVLENTRKPIAAVNVESAAEARYVAELAAAVRGGAEALRERPLHITGFSPTSPLTISAGVAGAIRELSLRGLPFRSLPTPLMGGTGPITVAGTLAQQTAEILACFVIGYLYAPGVPVVYASRPSSLDMHTFASLWTAPELAVLSVWAAQLCRRYGIPCDVQCSTSSKAFDAQNGYERGYFTMVVAAAGAHLLGGCGHINDVLVASLPQLVIDDEILDMALWTARGCEVSEDTLAVDNIRRAVEGQQFLKQRHTRDHFRAGALWRPALADRQVYREWLRQGATTVDRRAAGRVRQILAEHEIPPLPDAAQREMAEILTEATRKLEEA